MYLPPRLTIRCALEDLGLDNWDDNGPIGDATHHVNHPVVDRAIELFPQDRDPSKAPEKISSVKPTCYKIKVSRFRGIAYIDAESQVWIVAAGKRKGRDRDDFYQQFMRRCRAENGWWLPNKSDYASRTGDIKANRLLEWRLGLYEQVSSVLTKIDSSHSLRLNGDPTFQINLDEIVQHLDKSITPQSLPEVSVRLISLGGEEYLGIEVVQEQVFDQRLQALCLLGIETVAAAIYDDEQSWSKDDLTPSGTPQFVLEFNEEVGLGTVLDRHHSAKPPAWFKPGTKHHYVSQVENGSHIRSVADATAFGEPVFALCGTTFVPRQDHHNLAPCPRCIAVHNLLQNAKEG
ncbi:DUF3039 domain-containing protein [Corynebacterium sp. ACRPQ]|uniref:DUF3039 domain-containing protein n=1 Tax=Corynebacterium sp. ACRPQ TaxID=2918201 RepID=UPI001EF23F7A|nr:DUF3039 domain-containing protein [Corynebacterium sp. ACRPQ]MCG7440244.1 DUF3039 domain-containing protein [Corynebacterium sp. ACRPQ]